jgi:hypothetical protein
MGQKTSTFPFDAKLAAIARLTNSVVGIVVQTGINEFDIIPFAGSSVANADVVYINDPNAEGLTPLDPTQPCTAYSLDGTGAFYGWNINLQIWN